MRNSNMVIYFDNKKKTVIDLSKDCCSFAVWQTSHGLDYAACKHPNDFLIFLRPDEIDAVDEYRNGDPYGLKEDIKNDFQQRRVNCTIDLIKTVKEVNNSKLLDLGCGQGHLTNNIKNNFPTYDVYGLDYSLSAINSAASTFPDINFIVANAYSPPFPDNSFDMVVCNNIWEHVPDPLTMLTAIKRILKPGGQLIISTPSRYRLGNLVNIIKGKNIILLNKSHITEYSVGQVIEQLSYGGFEVNKVLSTSLKERNFTGRLFKSFLTFIIRIRKNHHILESTAFFLATKKKIK